MSRQVTPAAKIDRLRETETALTRAFALEGIDRVRFMGTRREWLPCRDRAYLEAVRAGFTITEIALAMDIDRIDVRRCMRRARSAERKKEQA